MSGLASGRTFDVATLSDVGTERPNNEDRAGILEDGPTAVVFAVADGVGGYEGGEKASEMAVDITLRTYREAPAAWGPYKRLSRAVQQANIEIHDLTLIVPELNRMASTLTAVAIDGGTLSAAHVGDCRLYLLRDGRVVQLSKDHTLAASREKMSVFAKETARKYPERGTLTRCLGPELIVAIDRITTPLVEGDVVVLCSDGVHTILDAADLLQATDASDAETACRTLIDAANGRGTGDNVTVAVFRQLVAPPARDLPTGWRERFWRLFG